MTGNLNNRLNPQMVHEQAVPTIVKGMERTWIIAMLVLLLVLQLSTCKLGGEGQHVAERVVDTP